MAITCSTTRGLQTTVNAVFSWTTTTVTSARHPSRPPSQTDPTLLAHPHALDHLPDTQPFGTRPLSNTSRPLRPLASPVSPTRPRSSSRRNRPRRVRVAVPSVTTSTSYFSITLPTRGYSRPRTRPSRRQRRNKSRSSANVRRPLSLVASTSRSSLLFPTSPRSQTFPLLLSNTSTSTTTTRVPTVYKPLRKKRFTVPCRTFTRMPRRIIITWMRHFSLSPMRTCKG